MYVAFTILLHLQLNTHTFEWVYDYERIDISTNEVTFGESIIKSSPKTVLTREGIELFHKALHEKEYKSLGVFQINPDRFWILEDDDGFALAQPFGVEIKDKGKIAVWTIDKEVRLVKNV